MDIQRYPSVSRRRYRSQCRPGERITASVLGICKGVVLWRWVCAVMLSLASAFVPVASAEVANTPKAVFVILDGIPADVIERVETPHLDAIASVGGYARASVGGPVGQPGQTPTVSAPGYMNLVTGTWANKHNVYENYNLSPNYAYWNLFRVVKTVDPARKIGIFSTWTDNRTVLLGERQPEAGDWVFDYVVDGLEIDEVRFPTLRSLMTRSRKEQQQSLSERGRISLGSTCSTPMTSAMSMATASYLIGPSWIWMPASAPSGLRLRPAKRRTPKTGLSL
jgi:hypothetical protein